MIHYLSKLLALPVYPVGAAFIAAVLAATFAKKKNYRAATRWAVAAGAILWLFATDPCSRWLVRSLEGRYSPADHFPQVTAVVLLTGGEVAGNPPRRYDELNAAGDRVLYAARLMREHAAPRLIITGGTVPFGTKIKGSIAEVSDRIITGLFDIDTLAIVLEKRARDTRENALFTKLVLDSLGERPVIILVTSALHMPRSVMAFKKVGCTVYPAPCDYLADAPLPFNALHLFPSADALVNSTNALHELYGIAVYRLLGWI